MSTVSFNEIESVCIRELTREDLGTLLRVLWGWDNAWDLSEAAWIVWVMYTTRMEQEQCQDT